MERQISLHPSAAREGDRVVIRGHGFGDCSLRLVVNGKSQRPAAIAFGYPMPGGFRPGHDGTFVVEWRVGDLGDGEHVVAVEAITTTAARKRRCGYGIHIRGKTTAEARRRKADDEPWTMTGDETPDTARRAPAGSSAFVSARQRSPQRSRGGDRSPARCRACPTGPGQGRVAHRAGHLQLTPAGPGRRGMRNPPTPAARKPW